MSQEDIAGTASTVLVKSSLDKDLEKLVHVEAAARKASIGVLSHGLALVFLGLSGLLAALYSGIASESAVIVLAAILGGYMALNIGANDVANNVGPAVGARALTIFGALVIAAVFESAGALIAGGDVVETISKGIIDPARVPDNNTFIWAMMSALISSALWVNFATWIGAPVSTTHAVVGGVVGAGIVAAGIDLVNWEVMGSIAASWVISPLMGGAIAALILAFIKLKLIYQPDKIASARRWIPLLIAIMAGSFICYLSVKAFGRLWQPSAATVTAIGVGAFLLSWAAAHPLIRRQSEGMENRNQSLRRLFRLPLICAAALLSFAHGANDVANAIGPLAGILHAAEFGSIAGEVAVPAWIMLIGAFGISLGLFLYGPKLIRMVGDQITKLNPMRAYCVALSAAVTVLVASWLGMPVSSTHIAIGGVFGVGFFREQFTKRSRRRAMMVGRTVGRYHPLQPQPAVEEMRHRKLVRRSHFLSIVAAWVITVPATALLSAGAYLLFELMR